MALEKIGLSFLASLVLLLACDADAPEELAPPDDSSQPGESERAQEARKADEPFDCGGIGNVCGVCPENSWCEGSHPVVACVPDQQWCGGYLNEPCPEEFPICTIFAHGYYGTCFSQDQVDCLCARRPGALVPEACERQPEPV